MFSLSHIAVLLVDGYNTIGRCPKLSRIRDHHGHEEARRALTERLINYTALKSLETHIVFDAQLRNSPATREQLTDHCFIHFTNYECTADTYIEKLCAQRRNRAARNLRTIVATSDRAQQLTVQGYGAEWMSAEKLTADIHHVFERSRKEYKHTVKRPSDRLGGRIDPATQERLQEMRFGL